jgi:hypothetical protein
MVLKGDGWDDALLLETNLKATLRRNIFSRLLGYIFAARFYR